MILNCTKKISRILRWMFLETRGINSAGVVGLLGLLTAEPKCKSVARIRAAMCNIAIWITCRKTTWDELIRVPRPLARILDQGTVIIDDDSLPSERCLAPNFDHCIVYCCCVQVANRDCVPAIR
jgi:hypothetical protein